MLTRHGHGDHRRRRPRPGPLRRDDYRTSTVTADSSQRSDSESRRARAHHLQVAQVILGNIEINILQYAIEY